MLVLRVGIDVKPGVLAVIVLPTVAITAVGFVAFTCARIWIWSVWAFCSLAASLAALRWAWPKE